MTDPSPPRRRRRTSPQPLAPLGERISVLLVDDHALVCSGLTVLLGAAEDIIVVGQAQDGREAVKQALRLKPDVIVMDIAMPKLNGIEAARQVLAALPEVRVVMLSAHNDQEYIRAARSLGAAAFVLKASPLQYLAKAIRGAVAANGTSDGSRPRPATRQPPEPDAATTAAARLTPREREVLQLIAESRSNKEVATALGIAVKTVEKHRQHLMAALDIHDVAGLTRYAIEQGIIEGRNRGGSF